MKIQMLVSGAAVALLAVSAAASPARRRYPALFRLVNDTHRHDYYGDAVHDKRDYGSLPHAGTATGLTITTADAIRTPIHGYTTSPVSLVTSASSVSLATSASSVSVFVPSFSAEPSVVTVTTTVTAIYSSPASSSASSTSSSYFITTATSSSSAIFNQTFTATLGFPTNTSSALPVSTSTYDTCTEEPTSSSSSSYSLPAPTYSDYSYSSSSSSYDGTSSVPYHTPATSFSSTVPLTTAPLTTAPLTTAPLTTAPLTTAPLTTAPLTTAPLSTAPSAGLSSSAFSSPRWTNTSSQATVTTTTTVTYAATTEYLTTVELPRATSSIYILTAPSLSVPASVPFLNATASVSVPSVSEAVPTSDKTSFHLDAAGRLIKPTRKVWGPAHPEDARRD